MKENLSRLDESVVGVGRHQDLWRKPDAAALMKLNGKSVRVSQPYDVQVLPMIGRDSEMRRILAAWMGPSPLAPLLKSDPGLGKNRVVYQCAIACAQELYPFQGHEDITAEDIACTVRFSDDPQRKMDYVLSPIVTAMLRGGIAFVDEIGKIRPRALAPLVPLLDDRRYLDSVILGERIYAHPRFRFIAATNSADLEAGLLPEFILSRTRPVIGLSYPRREELDAIVATRYAAADGKIKRLQSSFWRLWREKCGDKAPTPRDSIYLFGMALNLAGFEAVVRDRPYALDHANSAAALEKRHLEEAFEAFFNSDERNGP